MTTPTVVLGGNGYVSCELLRLLSTHPTLHVEAVVSKSRPGAAIGDVFPHLALAYPEQRLVDGAALDSVFAGANDVAIFSAGPHGESAGDIDAVLTRAESAGATPRLVDLSADHRFDDVERYQKIYGVEHGAPQRLKQFVCAVPEHETKRTVHACHPGCFTTAVTLPSVALVGLELIEPTIHVSAITGSTGSGRTPKATTHHPERLSNVFAYGALAHRHQHEMEGLVESATGIDTKISFVPHSGPFARGIHATLFATLHRPMSAGAVAEAMSSFYAKSPFVRVQTTMPKLKHVVGTNGCAIGVAVDGQQLVVCSVIDNLVKGAAGGAVQWMNRLLGFDERDGLMTPGLGWF